MSLFNSKKEFNLNNGERWEFDSLFLNVHQHTKIEFKLLSRHRQNSFPELKGEELIYHFLLKNKYMAFIDCSKYFIRNKKEMSIFNSDSDFTFFHLPYDIIEYPKIFYKVSFTRQIKKNGNYSAYDKFFFEFETGVNQFDETTVLFSKKLKQTIKRKSVALIKSNFK